MVKAAVYIVSYKDADSDFQSLSAPDPMRDAELEKWLYQEVLNPLQDKTWQEGQTAYLYRTRKTRTSEYLVACRIVGRVKANRRPYRELIAVYVDWAALMDERAPHAYFAGVPWDRLIQNCPGMVELSAIEPSGDEFDRALRDQVRRQFAGGQPVTLTRFWKNLDRPATLYWVLSGIPDQDAGGNALEKTRIPVAMGFAGGWNLHDEYAIRVLAVAEETAYDPGSAASRVFAEHRSTNLLLKYIPNCCLDLRGVEAFVGCLNLTVMEAVQQGPTDPDLLASLVKAAQGQLQFIRGQFQDELSAVQSRDGLSAGTANDLTQAWEGRAGPLASRLKAMEQSVRGLPRTALLTFDDVRRLATQALQDSRASFLQSLAQEAPVPKEKELRRLVEQAVQDKETRRTIERIVQDKIAALPAVAATEKTGGPVPALSPNPGGRRRLVLNRPGKLAVYGVLGSFALATIGWGVLKIASQAPTPAAPPPSAQGSKGAGKGRDVGKGKAGGADATVPNKPSGLATAVWNAEQHQVESLLGQGTAVENDLSGASVFSYVYEPSESRKQQAPLLLKIEVAFREDTSHSSSVTFSFKPDTPVKKALEQIGFGKTKVGNVRWAQGKGPKKGESAQQIQPVTAPDLPNCQVEYWTTLVAGGKVTKAELRLMTPKEK